MIFAALLIAQIVPSPTAPKATEATVAAIRANPKRFDGRVVRLTGWLNRCDAQSCTIDERPATAASGPGRQLSVVGDDKFQKTIRPLLPTYVEFDASFDARCMEACSEGPPHLTVRQLRAVVSPEPPEFEN